MIGDGPLLTKARQLAQELRAPVEFLGARNPTEVLENLHLARVFCLPSITATNGDAEGLPIVLLEAQACGVPVITSAQGSCEEAMLPGKSGDAFREGDVAQLEDRLEQWLMDDALARAASGAARQFMMDAFDMRHCTRQLESAYNSLLASSS
jgi:glycosyltransferase involved in cell wall biosynthesis